MVQVNTRSELVHVKTNNLQSSSGYEFIGEKNGICLTLCLLCALSIVEMYFQPGVVGNKESFSYAGAESQHLKDHTSLVGLYLNRPVQPFS